MFSLVCTLAAVGVVAMTQAYRATMPQKPRVETANLVPVKEARKEVATAPVVANTNAGAGPLASRQLAMPVQGYDARKLRDNFDETRGGVRRHEALDIMAPRGTPVVAVDDGKVAKLLRNPIGGVTLYQFDRDESRVFYYAHLDSYAQGVSEGLAVRRGDILGFVGSTGNAPEHAPHLHFAIHELADGDKRWWRGTPVNPYPLLKPE